MVKRNKRGYFVGKNGRLIHRSIAYYRIYKKNREKYPLPFSEYVVHHKDGNKRHNSVANLKIMERHWHHASHGHLLKAFFRFLLKK